MLAGCPAPSPGEETATAPTTGTSEGEGESSTAASADPPTGTTDASSTTTGTTDAQATTTSTTDPSSTTAATTTAEPGTTSEDTTSTGPGPGTCGNGELDPGEACDDGNTLPGDGCLPNCTPGDGAALPPIELPPEPWTCLTTIDAAVVGQPSHVLMLGGWTGSPPLSAIVQGFVLPDGQMSPGSFVHPGSFDRLVDQVATTADGDVIVAGHIYTDAQQTAGHLWLARVTAAGEVVWLHEHEAIPTDPTDLALTPTGDIVLASRVAGWGGGPKPSFVQVFSPEGELQWEHAAPAGPESHFGYAGVTVDASGTIYAVGHGQHMGDPKWRLLLAALAGDGAPLWQTEMPAPMKLRVRPTGIVVTDDEMLLVVETESDTDVRVRRPARPGRVRPRRGAALVEDGAAARRLDHVGRPHRRGPGERSAGRLGDERGGHQQHPGRPLRRGRRAAVGARVRQPGRPPGRGSRPRRAVLRARGQLRAPVLAVSVAGPTNLRMARETGR
ncbi:hypothetical protein [Nannocystis pusilla]|uniref:hypothetical protein n=1 Tax=Nannocystis pusilla TaxID=889268 RepID=UPI003DA417F1